MNADSARLRWRCRRGMRELEVLLFHWLETGYPHSTEGEKSAFVQLLDTPDPLLWEWLILGRPCPDPYLAPLCSIIHKMM